MMVTCQHFLLVLAAMSSFSFATATIIEQKTPWVYVAASSDFTKQVATISNGVAAGRTIYTSIDSGLTWKEVLTMSKKTWHGPITISDDGTKLAVIEHVLKTESPLSSLPPSPSPSPSEKQGLEIDAGRVPEKKNGKGKDKVMEWLKTLNLERLHSNFISEDIDSLHVVSLLNENDLKELGIVKMGPRKILIHAIQQLNENDSVFSEKSSPSPSPTNTIDSSSMVIHAYIWISVDSGVTWQVDTSIGTHQHLINIVASNDGTNLVAATSGGNLWISADAGSTWVEDTSVGEPKAWKELECFSEDGMKWFASEDNGKKWISDNAGETWVEHLMSGRYQSKEGINDSTETKALQFTMSQDGTQMACFQSDDYDYLTDGFRFTSIDLGLTWVKHAAADVKHEWINNVMSSLIGCQHSMLDYYGM